MGLPLTSRVLDIGTRYGTFIDCLVKSGYQNAFGIDIDENLLECGRTVYPHLRERLRMYDGRVIPFADSVFDTVTMFDVLEHIPDVGTYLEEVLRVLRPGALVVFQTPNRYINIPWEIVQHRSLTQWRGFHCSLQTLRSLRQLLIQSGFEGVCIEKHSVRSGHRYYHASRQLGPIGPFLVRLAMSMPLPLYPNFWGFAKKLAPAASKSSGVAKNLEITDSSQLDVLESAWIHAKKIGLCYK